MTASDDTASRAFYVNKRWEEVRARRTALYRLYDEAGVLLYVGISCNLNERWKDHREEKLWWPQVVEKQVEWYEKRSEAESAEVHAIVTEDPLYNIDWNRPEYKLRYRLGWLSDRIEEEERQIRTPRRTPRSKRGKEALVDLLRRRDLLQEHTPGHEWEWDGKALSVHKHDMIDCLDSACLSQAHRIIDTSCWSACEPWPAEAILVETRRLRGECPACSGEQAPCSVVRELAERYSGHPYHCF
ncbi:GIY-YIG nuclease family protein [Streptomyces pseudogriseolus]|uniref:GIY-YIG nuclease family protein n=1 Tax=Streptomyces pseudogriseolus TaxID=36817 RepID=UPI003FA30E4A